MENNDSDQTCHSRNSYQRWINLENHLYAVISESGGHGEQQ